jgi:cystathionine beta-synthase
VKGTVYAKIETTNPGNSIKDRMAVKMIEDAERSGALKPGGTIIEGTSGNTGMGLAIAAVIKGYRCVFTTTDKQSKEKADALRAFGAEVIVCPTNVEPEDPRSYYSVSSRLEKEVPNSWKANQYDNRRTRRALRADRPGNLGADRRTITHLVCGVGTGGTISGVGQVPQGEEPEDQGVGHRHLRLGAEEVQGDGRPRQERDLSLHHRGHRRGLPAEERRLLVIDYSRRSPTRTRR